MKIFEKLKDQVVAIHVGAELYGESFPKALFKLIKRNFKKNKE